MIWDSSLIAKYDLSGPRYTSYPTAPQFDSSISKIALIDKMLTPSEAPLSLYFHIPFCAHLCYYCACNKIVTKQYDKGAEYVELLGEEMRLRSLMLDHSREVTQLHFGGGTPTFLTEELIEVLFDNIQQHFNLINDGTQDYSIEIDPREISRSKLKLLTEKGINRISIGVQDFDIKVQEAIHRVQPVKMVADLVKDARELDIKSINFDLIYGLPYQSIEGFRETLAQVIELSPERISLFNYAHLPDRFRAQRRISDDSLPVSSMKLDLLKMSIEYLIAAGYEYIGMDHFAKSTDSLAIAQKQGKLQRNFQGYTTHAGTDLVAFGVSAISDLNGVYIQNHTDLSIYRSSIEKGQLAIAKGYISDLDDRIRHQVIMTLISQFELNTAIIEQKYNIRFFEYFFEEMENLTPMTKDGMLDIDRSGMQTTIKVTERGRLLIRCICMVFDKYLNGAIKYSKVI
ncbi:MAG: oxygen-independent coproporphyrinogen III oxidase [Gammaproteobacteria bacterium]|uniref:Coproporphyrinogen-III oxidase n=1 Tax=Marinomonas polaris DSM 16579 TaxID=1122206 RepID=A0A1M4ZKP7_9GAMM|nr:MULTISPECIES: oxygen-independent coproporphyrinogen III oxidase [Marinomonas]MBU1293565.1 oxygen-independent coproporphyrinogen III oxidase [Gammaproteobacteria bacterium]MBU1465613.1 oxygen-independent coproporphyrinogen III oxidase [Gammaproteobacteria bacterium]MBU2021702.1 oxygen-independent coproporphyrinogen III oxidase [Gammaproteobacteria bacterium]MBU2317240.1 oxygen-independent coproporphyrinogen III oxidase [Gammaproteobacteria bacterium]MBU2414865.1 oxygen-independent coproporph